MSLIPYFRRLPRARLSARLAFTSLYLLGAIAVGLLVTGHGYPDEFMYVQYLFLAALVLTWVALDGKPQTTGARVFSAIVAVIGFGGFLETGSWVLFAVAVSCALFASVSGEPLP